MNQNHSDELSLLSNSADSSISDNSMAIPAARPEESTAQTSGGVCETQCIESTDSIRFGRRSIADNDSDNESMLLLQP
jgi:hypothetical protein